VSGWIKWEKEIEADPRVLRMARDLKRICNAGAFHPVTLVCGGLVRLWSYADSHAREDDTLDLGAAELDELIGIPGFCSIIPPDWLREIDDHTVELPNFQAHNGTEARKKALTQKRVETHRKRGSVTGALTTTLPDQDQTKTKTSKRVPSEPCPAERDDDPFAGDVEVVFSHWRTTFGHPRAQLDGKRRKLIRDRLRDYTVDDLRLAIDGYRHSPHHMGQNDRATVYDDIEVFLRDAKHVDAGLRFARDPPRTDLSAQTRRNVVAVADWIPPEARNAAG
jgi:hypothetical protein